MVKRTGKKGKEAMFDYQERIETLINNEIAAGEIAGANLMVIKDGEEKFFQSFGQMDLEYGKPMKRDTIFRMFSMSKPITACATMILEERGPQIQEIKKIF